MTYLEEAARRAALIGKPIVEESTEIAEQPIVSETTVGPKYRYAYVAIAVYLVVWAVIGFVESAVSQ